MEDFNEPLNLTINKSKGEDLTLSTETPASTTTLMGAAEDFSELLAINTSANVWSQIPSESVVMTPPEDFGELLKVNTSDGVFFSPLTVSDEVEDFSELITIITDKLLYPSASTSLISPHLVVTSGGAEVDHPPVIIHSVTSQNLPLGPNPLQGGEQTPFLKNFKNAVNFVNKVKVRFVEQPERYMEFNGVMDEHRKNKRKFQESPEYLTKRTESNSEILSRMAKLFENNDDLLIEFRRFQNFPNWITETEPSPATPPTNKKSEAEIMSLTVLDGEIDLNALQPLQGSSVPIQKMETIEIESNYELLQSPVEITEPVPKKPRFSYVPDVNLNHTSLPEATRYETLQIENSLILEKVRNETDPETYQKILHHLFSFSMELISGQELLSLVKPLCTDFLEVHVSFKDLVKCCQSKHDVNIPRNCVQEDCNYYKTCKRLDVSYCPAPKNVLQPLCTGRTDLCREVLNDDWVCIPSSISQSVAPNVASPQHEAYLCNREDDRCQLDVILDSITDTIIVFEKVTKKMSQMTLDEISKYELDDRLGGDSETIHRNCVKILYGEKADSIISGLKRIPVLAIPMLLKRLKIKEKEWRKAQREFNNLSEDEYYTKTSLHFENSERQKN